MRQPPVPSRQGQTGRAVGSHRAAALVLAAAFTLQFGAAIAVLLFPRVGPAGAATLRLVMAAALLLLVARPRLRGHSRADAAVAVGFGLALGAMNTCFYLAAARLPLGAAVTLEFLGPLGLAVAVSRRPRDLLWVAGAAAGVLLLGGTGGTALGRLDPVGVGFALAAAVCWAGYILLSAQAGRRFPRMEGLAIAMTVAALAVLPLGLATAGTALLVPETLTLGVVVALLSSVLPYSMELAALRSLPAGTFGILMSLEPAVAALAGFLVLGQILSPRQLIAISLVVLASIGATATATATATAAAARPVAEPV